MRKLLLITSVIFLFSACSTTNKKLDSKCYALPKTGKCKAMFNKYYFDFNTNSCKTFIWGGCGGNIPFHSLEECKKTCE